MDQAFTLRKIAARGEEDEGTAPDGTCHNVRVIAVTSGKGGVGKTNTVANISVALAQMGKRVLLLDADLGLGNLDILLGLAPKYNIGHFLRGEKTLDEVIVNGPAGVMILPASSGLTELTDLAAEQRLALDAHLEELAERIDIMIIDTAAGISDNVLFFNMAAQEIVVVASPEPTSITDAYAMMKVMHKKYGERAFKLLVNSVKSRQEGMEVYRKLSLVAAKFLNVSVDYLGCVLYDENVQNSVIQQRAVLEAFPSTMASVCYREIAKGLSELSVCNELKGGIQFFWRKMVGSGF